MHGRKSGLFSREFARNLPCLRPMMNTAKKKGEKRPSRETIIEACAEWLATPQPLRDCKTLHQLALRLGIHGSGRFYALANSAEVYHRMLVKTAGGALRQAPHILNVVAERALAGHSHSAEIYLGFLRHVLTDKRFLQLGKTKDIERASDPILDVYLSVSEWLGSNHTGITPKAEE